MSFTTPLQSDDNGADSRDKINDNFTAVENEIDILVVAGAPLATDSVKGRVKLSVAPVDAAEPTAVGDNDPLLAMLTDAVSTPSTPQTDDDGKLVKLNANGQIPGDFIKNKEIQYFTSGGTWTKPAGLQFVEVEVQAKGGNGGNGNSLSSPNLGGGGGGGGAYARKRFATSALGSSEAITIDTTSATFGTHIECTNGANGVTASRSTFGIQVGGAGGVATGGDININGQDGNASGRSSDTSQAGDGGNTFLGVGGRSPTSNPATGQNGRGYGAGASGGFGSGGGSNINGGSGAPGIVIVHEYF
jgi:hypothetical protein